MMGMEGTASARVEKKLLSPMPDPSMKTATDAAGSDDGVRASSVLATLPPECSFRFPYPLKRKTNPWGTVDKIHRAEALFAVDGQFEVTDREDRPAFPAKNGKRLPRRTWLCHGRSRGGNRNRTGVHVSPGHAGNSMIPPWLQGLGPRFLFPAIPCDGVALGRDALGLDTEYRGFAVIVQIDDGLSFRVEFHVRDPI